MKTDMSTERETEQPKVITHAEMRADLGAMVSKANARQPAPAPSLPTAPFRKHGNQVDQEIRDSIVSALRGYAYVCGRVWSAWQVGTMTEDDFSPAWESEDLVSELENVVLDAIHAATDRVRAQPAPAAGKSPKVNLEMSELYTIAVAHGYPNPKVMMDDLDAARAEGERLKRDKDELVRQHNALIDELNSEQDDNASLRDEAAALRGALDPCYRGYEAIIKLLEPDEVSEDAIAEALSIAGNVLERRLTGSAGAGCDLLRVLEENYWDLRQHEIRFDDDSDVMWHVVEFYMDEPRERIRGYGNTPREAILDAQKDPSDPTKWDYVPDEDEPLPPPPAAEGGGL